MGRIQLKPLTNTNSEDMMAKVLGVTNEKLTSIRNSVIQVLMSSTVMPFRWLRSSYRCFYCYEVFKEPRELKSHQINHGSSEIRHAVENFREPEVSVDISNIFCKMCPKEAANFDQLIEHLIFEHDINIDTDVGLGVTAYKLEDISVRCAICDKQFRTFGHLLVHSNRDHKSWSEVLCDVCGEHFKNSKHLRQHIRTVHSNDIACTLCGLKIFSMNKMRTHMQNMHHHKYKCFTCPEQFDTHYKRSQHMMLVHKSREQVKCTWCPRTFLYRSTMMRHVRETHLQERTFICSICGWRCFSQYDLRKHNMKHTNDRNFKCTNCEKAFKTMKTMKQHFNNIHRKNIINSNPNEILTDNIAV